MFLVPPRMLTWTPNSKLPRSQHHHLRHRGTRRASSLLMARGLWLRSRQQQPMRQARSWSSHEETAVRCRQITLAPMCLLVQHRPSARRAKVRCTVMPIALAHDRVSRGTSLSPQARLVRRLLTVDAFHRTPLARYQRLVVSFWVKEPGRIEKGVQALLLVVIQQ